MTLGEARQAALVTDHRYAQNYRLLRRWSTLQHFGPRLPTLVAGSRSCNRLASNMQLEELATRGRKYLVVSRPLMDGHPGRMTIARRLGARADPSRATRTCSLGAFSEDQVTCLDFPFDSFKATPESFDHTLVTGGVNPRTTSPEPGHKIYPYFLRGIEITRPNQVWAMDITYIPMAQNFG